MIAAPARISVRELLGFVGGRTLSFDVVPAILKYLRLQAGSAGSQQDFERYVKAVETNDLRSILDRSTRCCNVSPR